MKHILFIVLAITSTIPVAAQPELDTTFFGTGKRVVEFGASASTQDMVVQSDRKMVFVSPCNHISRGPRAFCIARVNEDGTLDTTLGANSGTPGGVFHDVASTGVRGVALQYDQKLVLVGGGTQVVIARYLSDGTPDPSFGTGGVVISDVTPLASDFAQKIAIQPDRKMVVVGYTKEGVDELFVARYLYNGLLDTSFGTSGVARVTLPGNVTAGMSVALGADGKILVGGMAFSANLLARFNSNGTLDNSWGGGGVITFDGAGSIVGEGGIRSISVRPDGRVLALSYNNTLYKFNSDGTPDASFDGDGARLALISGSESFQFRVTAGERITVVGGRKRPIPNISLPYPYRIARYWADGSPETTFSDDGYLEIDVHPGMADSARAIAVDPVGRVAVGGFSSVCCVQDPFEQRQFSAARLVSVPSGFVTIFGRVTGSDGSPARNAFVTIKNSSGGAAGNTITNPFGYYRVAFIMSGQRYAISATAKGISFPDQIIDPNDDLVAFDMVAEPKSALSSTLD
jgi:uncharacterized delta-60 repeat protein